MRDLATYLCCAEPIRPKVHNGFDLYFIKQSKIFRETSIYGKKNLKYETIGNVLKVVFNLKNNASWETRPAERARHCGMQVCTQARYAALLRMHAAVNCCNLSSKVRLSFLRFPKEADRYRNVAVEIQDISKKHV
jgi:hypothetical protein